MSEKTSNLIKGLLACLLLLSFVSVVHATDDKRFTLNDGVIYDLQLGIQWAPAPDRTMNHYQAKNYARNLNLAGGGWHLPTMQQLKSLYDPSKHGGVDPEFNVGEYWIWTSEVDGPSGAWDCNFLVDSGRRCRRDDSSANGTVRVLVVRSGR
jgi:hypothetical protein